MCRYITRGWGEGGNGTNCHKRCGSLKEYTCQTTTKQRSICRDEAMGNIYLTEKFDQNEILRDQNCSFLQIAKERGNKELKEKKKKMQRKDFSRIKFRDRERPCGKSSNRDGGSACVDVCSGVLLVQEEDSGGIRHDFFVITIAE